MGVGSVLTTELSGNGTSLVGPLFTLAVDPLLGPLTLEQADNDKRPDTAMPRIRNFFKFFIKPPLKLERESCSFSHGPASPPNSGRIKAFPIPTLPKIAAEGFRGKARTLHGNARHFAGQ